MKTILVLEDELIIIKLLRHSLQKYRVLEAATADEALALFDANDRHIDLLLADLTLPTSSGLRVAFYLRAELRDLPVIVTSGNPVENWTPHDQDDLARLGPDTVAILQKPFPTKVLLSLVHELLETGSSGDVNLSGADA
jgi:CheY-like chemotaxis protein